MGCWAIGRRPASELHHGRDERAEADHREEDGRRGLEKRPAERSRERRKHPQDGDGADDAQRLRGGSGAGLPQQQRRGGQRRRRRGQRPAEQRTVGAVADRQQSPADQPGDRESRDDDRRAPAVAVKRLGLADIVQPQLLDFRRHALEPRQAMRPQQSVEGGDDHARSGGQREAALPIGGREEGDREQQSAAEQGVRQPHRRQGVAHRGAVGVRREQDEAERSAAGERCRVSRQAALFVLVVDPEQDRRRGGEGEVDQELEADRQRQRAGDAEGR
ncbi:MAG TPA: hypothetical protein VE403_07055, partial [Sphingomicrobium sp.]|nr:hypothetical protein [Sphingomicrobium sp.]